MENGNESDMMEYIVERSVNGRNYMRSVPLLLLTGLSTITILPITI